MLRHIFNFFSLQSFSKLTAW